LNVQDLAVGKTNNLQPYLFRFLQEVDVGAEVNITIDVSSSAGIPEDILENRIVEGLDQLGIVVRWEEG
jgi:ribosomal protein L21E